MEAYTTKKETTLKDFLTILFKHKFLLIFTILIVIVPVYINMKLKTPVYVAVVKMLITAEKEREGLYQKPFYFGSEATISSHTELVRSKRVIERVVNALRLYEIPLDYEKKFSTKLKAFLIDREIKKLKEKLEELSPKQRQAYLFQRAVDYLGSRIDVITSKESSVFMITVKDFNPYFAVILANAVSRSYVIFDLEQQIAELQLKYGWRNPVVIQLENYIEDIQKTLDGKPIPDLEAFGPATVKIMDQARDASLVKGVSERLVLTLAFLASLCAGILLSLLFENLNQTFRSPRDVEDILKIPFLGSIPKRRSKDKLLIAHTNPATEYSFFYQSLSDQILLLIKDKNLRSILIANDGSSKDTATVITNIGVCLARERSLKVFIIDADLRNAPVAELLKISNSPGLSDVLEGKISFEDAIQVIESNLNVLVAGKTVFNPTTLLSSSKMSELIKKAEEGHEVVLLNCADLRNFTDAVVLSSITDSIALVINEGKVRRQVIKKAILPLQEKKANIIGVILNNRRFPIPKMIYKWI